MFWVKLENIGVCRKQFGHHLFAMIPHRRFLCVADSLGLNHIGGAAPDCIRRCCSEGIRASSGDFHVRPSKWGRRALHAMVAQRCVPPVATVQGTNDAQHCCCVFRCHIRHGVRHVDGRARDCESGRRAAVERNTFSNKTQATKYDGFGGGGDDDDGAGYLSFFSTSADMLH